MSISGQRNPQKSNLKNEFASEVTLKEIKETADVISIHSSLTKESYEILNTKFINECKKPFWLINTSRGNCVKINDLIKGIKEKKVLGAALDVLEFEKKSFEKLLETSMSNDDFSFLGEITLNYSGHGNYRLNLERLRLKYNYYKNHSLIIGKFHTPVNYWNDVYFHARLFFPTIDRPLMFSKWIPVHTFGMRLQGQNIGKNNFGYDLLVGSGMGSEDIYKVFS